MPAQKDNTSWKPVEGDHANDQTYARKAKNPTKPPTDEKRTAEETGNKIK